MIAIYARQSVERRDSISIDMQVETCLRMIPPDTLHRIFTDRGFSGTTTMRPAFQEMQEAIQNGEIQEVLVYKLDRISRSLCDFSSMMQVFRTQGVTLRSCRESFDTQTEIGGMLLNLLMMFAELEQKTIAGRVRDNYYARAVQQLFLGGTPPYGYRLEPCLLHEKQTALLKEVPTEATQVLWFYTHYGLCGENLEQLVQHCNRSGMTTRRGARWSNSAVTRILRNPIYVHGNLRSTLYLQEQGAILDHAPEAYCQGNGCLIYGDRKARRGAKLTHLSGEHAAAGLHAGLIDPSLWLAVQERFALRGGCTNRGTGQTSWLQGSVVCGLCGEHCYARNNGAGAAYTYFVCRGKRLGICNGISALHTAAVEQAVEPILAQQAAIVLPLAKQKESTRPDPVALELEALEQRMRRIAEMMGEPSAAVPFLRAELERLAKEREGCLQHCKRLAMPVEANAEQRWNKWWKHAGLEQRRRAVGILMQEIRVFPDTIQVVLR